MTIFSVCEKALGFLYRIFLSRTIGTEGIGLYQVALSLFSLILSACVSGIPITVSRLMMKYKSENDAKKVGGVITAGLTSALFITLPVCIIFYIFHPYFSFLFADNRCMTIFLILLPSIIFTSLYSVLRGVFWGNKDFLPYSLIELLEELCMIVVGIVLISLSTTTTSGAISAGIAVFISLTFSFTLASIVFFVRKNKLYNPLKLYKPLLSSAIPITAMRTANTLSISLVSIILPLRLVASGLSSEMAMSEFGSAVGQALPLLFIPSTITNSFTLVLIPEIAETFYKKNHVILRSNVEKSVKFTIFISCLFIPLFFVCGEELGIVIFDNADCGKYLSASSFMLFFIGLSGISTSILNSLGQEKKTLLYYVISSVFMLASVWFLPKYIGIYSLITGFAFVYVISSVLNIKLLNKQCFYKPRILAFLSYSSLLLLPTVLLCFLIKNIILSFFGSVITLLIIATVSVLTLFLLYCAFDVIDISIIKRRFTIKRKKAVF